MQRIRQFLNQHPAMGWCLAGALLVLVAVSMWRFQRDDNPYNLSRMTENVVIKCRETGEEWTIPRGRMEQILWDRPAPLDLSQGLPNPKTGRLTGFPKSDWERTIDRISVERQEIANKRARGAAPATGK